MTRVEILQNIDALEEEEKTASDVRKNKIEQEIEFLGSKLLDRPGRQKKVDQLKAKGEYLTYTEIEWLYNSGVTKAEIRSITGVSWERLRAIGQGPERFYNPHLVQEDKEKAKRLLSGTTLSVAEVSRRAGVSYQFAWHHSKLIRDKTS